MIPQMLLKLLLPKAADYVAKIFKLDKVLKYVEEDNELDVQFRDVEKKCRSKWIGIKQNYTSTRSVGGERKISLHEGGGNSKCM